MIAISDSTLINLSFKNSQEKKFGSDDKKWKNKKSKKVDFLLGVVKQKYLPS